MSLQPTKTSALNTSLPGALSNPTIDGPKAKGLRRLLRVFYLILRPTNYMDDNVRRYGATFQIGADSESPLVYVGDPEIVRAVFALDDSMAETGRNNRVLQPMVGNHSILLLDGDPHRRQRKLLMPPFHGDRLRSYGALICDITRQVSADWQVGQSIVARPPIQSLTMGVILQAVFGLREGQRLSQLQQQLSTLLDFFSYPISASFLFFPGLQKNWGMWSPWTKFTRLREEVRSLIYAEIRERRQLLHDAESTQTQKTDILTLLLQSRDEQGEAMTDEELHDELVTLLLAGHETTASAVVWLLYWIHYLPAVQSKLRAELAALGAQPDPMAILQLPYLSALCLETLRIYPITPTTFVRVLKSTQTIAGHDFKAGTALMPATYIIHQRPDLYPEPKQFRPERFLERQFAPHEFLPFGGGHRRCIGSALAMMELKLSVARLLQDFELTLIRPRPLRPVRRGLTMAPPASIRFKVRSKRD